MPDYMVMGERGMADMGQMEMQIPDNTAPMMTGKGPYGGVEMGGMFSVLKVRKDQPPGNYKDSGWYQQPAGTQAWEWTGTLAELPGSPSAPNLSPSTAPAAAEVQIRKPAAAASGHKAHH
jgi:hypothetical protein